MKELHEFRIVITPFCNYRCFFCHSEGLTEECTPLLLTPSDYEFVVKVAKKNFGWDTATITGGEPLISPIYRETCRKIAGVGIKVTTVTNASLISNPNKVLGSNSQINVSLHSMDANVYRKITGTSYPLSQVIDTIITVRTMMPELEIHLNSTLVKGLNDDLESIEKVIQFAHKIDAVPKFINLASKNEKLVTTFEEIVEKVKSLGFETKERSVWQEKLVKDGKLVVVTRCGFSKQDAALGYRNLFLNPDGVISTEVPGDISINVIKEIRERNEAGLVQKIKWIFPPVR